MSYEVVRLGDVTNNLSNKRKPLNELDRNTMKEGILYPYYGANGIVDYINDYMIDEKVICIAEDGGSWGFQEKCSYIVNEKCWVNNHAHVLTEKSDKIILEYLFYYLNFSDLSPWITGTTRGKLTKGALDNLQIPLPPLDIQKKIADTLDKAQELIDKRKEQISALDKFLENLFLDMFGDPVSNPMGWEVKRLKNISTKILSGNTPKGGNQVYVDEGITFFRSQNVWKNRLILEDIAFIDEKTHKSMSNSSLKNGDILMTKTGRINTENSSLGRASLFTGEDDSANINGHVYLIRLEKEVINKFVLFILTTKEYRDYIRSVCVGGIDKRQINKNHLEEFPIIYPPIDLQNQFASIVEKVEAEKTKLEASLKEMEDNFNSIMQRAFKGELY